MAAFEVPDLHNLDDDEAATSINGQEDRHGTSPDHRGCTSEEHTADVYEQGCSRYWQELGKRHSCEGASR